MKQTLPLTLCFCVLLFATQAHAALPTPDELRSLFVVENPPLTNEFGALLIRNQFDQRASIGCDIRKSHPFALVLTDQEGAPVRDLTKVPSPPPARAVASMSPDAFTDQVQRAGEALARACVDIDLAPVAEIGSQRSYSNDPRQAAVWASRFAQAMQSAGVAPVLKHYPGKLASCRPVDSLPGFPLRRGSREVETCPGSPAQVWSMADAFPLASAQLVMLSNRVYPGVSNVPAVLDPVFVQHLRAADFRGLVLTDAMWELGRSPSLTVQAFRAGADVVVLSTSHDVDAGIAAILAAMRAGTLNPQDMQDRLARVADFRLAALVRRSTH